MSGETVFKTLRKPLDFNPTVCPSFYLSMVLSIIEQACTPHLHGGTAWYVAQGVTGKSIHDVELDSASKIQLPQFLLLRVLWQRIKRGNFRPCQFDLDKWVEETLMPTYCTRRALRFIYEQQTELAKFKEPTEGMS